MYIYNYTKNDSDTGAGYLISAINTTTNTITVSSGISQEWDDNDVIKGYVPSGSALGNTVESNDAVMTIDDVSFVLESGSVTFNFTVEYPNEWGSGSIYPAAYMEGKRSIDVSLTRLCRQADVGQFTNGVDGTLQDVKVIWGDADDQVQLDLDYVKFNYPQVGESGEAVTLTMTGKALGSSGEDSYLWTFK